MAALNVMALSSPASAVLSALIFNAIIIPLLIPLALRGVRYKPSGATQLLRGDQSDATCADGGAAPLVAREGAVVHAVRPVAGRAVVYWHETLHAGQPVGAAECKYCLRTDVMYRRDPPLATAPADAEAYELYQRARSLEGAGDAMAALDCLRRAKRLSPLIARAYRL